MAGHLMFNPNDLTELENQWREKSWHDEWTVRTIYATQFRALLANELERLLLGHASELDMVRRIEVLRNASIEWGD
jgi:hypothetical protein